MILVKEFFKKKLDENIVVLLDGCWYWTGAKNNGYGIVSFWNPKRDYRASRVSAHIYLDFDLESNLVVCHKCDNPSCCNPDHLFIGTQKDNIQDAIKKGRKILARQSLFCKSGLHKLENTNIKFNTNGGRSCKECNRIYSRNYMRKIRLETK